MMMTTLLASCLLASDGVGVSNVKDTGPQAQHNAVRGVAKMLGISLYAPDKTARGFSMRSIEHVKVSGGFSSLGDRSAVRMRFVNKSTSTAFDIYQLPSSEKVDSQKHMDWLIKGGYFEGGVSKHDTFTSMKRGDMDLGFVGGLVSGPSAKELMKRFVLISP
ncbi:MAG: hypothetical protein ACKVQS_05080 [Fimbriimonadaceae bacterium]